MEHRLLGGTGVRVSPLGLGTANFGGPTPGEEALRMIPRALEAGINLVDTASTYYGGETERIVGEALKGHRDQVILCTKVYFPESEDPNDRGNSRHHILSSVERSLERLQTEWIDLYLIHRPEFDLPQEETLRALDDLVRQGKVRYIGCSTFPAWMVMEALAISDRRRLARYVVEEPPYNLLDRRVENELIPLAQRYEMGVLPWSPTAMGILAGRYAGRDGFPEGSRAARVGSWAEARVTERAMDAAVRVASLAREHDLTPSQLALVWVKDQPGVTAPIIGPRTLDQLEEALPVLEMSLHPELANALDAIVPPGSAVSDFHNTSRWMRMKVEP